MVNLINTLSVTPPNGVWENIIFGFNSAFGNYALAIILLTVCIKLLMFPIDYFNRRSSSKMQEVQNKLQPKMTEIKKRYSDPNTQNQKIQELYQKEGFNPMGSCLIMLLVMVVSMGVFFTLFASLNNVAAYKITNQYEQLQTAYIQEYVMEEKGITKEQFNELELTQEEISGYIIKISSLEGEDAAKIIVAQKSVKERYSEVKESFLWIKNVWVADSPTSKAIASFETYASLAKLKLEGEDLDQAKQEYNAVMSALEKSEGVNGYFILAVLTGLTAFLYQYLLTKKKKQKENFYTKNAQQNPQANQGKAMLIILPIIMVVFTLSYNSIFALYIIISQLVGMATAPLINKFINMSNKKTSKK